MTYSRVSISRHAATRVRQRGYRQGDIEFVMRFGAEVPDGYLLRRKDAEQIAKYAKLKLPSDEARLIIERAMRLVGTFVAVLGDAAHVASIYHPCQRKLRHLLHGRGGAVRRNRKRTRR